MNSSDILKPEDTIAVTGLMEVVKGPVCIVVGGEEKKYMSGEEAIQDLRQQYQVNGIYATEDGLRIELQTGAAGGNEKDDTWMKEYKEETGEDVSFF